LDAVILTNYLMLVNHGGHNNDTSTCKIIFQVGCYNFLKGKKKKKKKKNNNNPQEDTKVLSCKFYKSSLICPEDIRKSEQHSNPS
jgi:hypothetical protein